MTIYKNDSGMWLFPTIKKQSGARPNLINLKMASQVQQQGNVFFRETIPMSDQQIEAIEKENMLRLKRPVVKLEKVSYLNEQKIEILERTETFAFLQITTLKRNPDGSVPTRVPYSRRELGETYWMVAGIHVGIQYELDAQDQPTRRITGRVESLRMNPNIELKVENERGVPTGEIGYNADKERVYQDFLNAIEDHKKMVATRAKKAEADSVTKQHKEKTSAFRDDLKKRIRTNRNELKVLMMAEKSVDNCLPDKKINAMIDKISQLEVLLNSCYNGNRR